ncbi:hypothetical protein CC85DRAFT_286504 [Cutaneotrichosporon oleaginosum]|uniref:Uncharacterized protein n=1 Tax=Cutaneotrichosporon oleaginosum TaxID=879819 RepID=A0A0J0XK61_9TREE|nr:uncharacterized protein CC85DRAFT_286504 [Cutaneotrichosporon oleaginosum]KLT41465.1 hypothetical protein CC85DRAFT_286504 [Cutaneotrichosporon oleaginosum]TXT12225.1 hypothetical protein COLE_02635 [Cutaneotrichosporon oleaginosum]
MSTPPSPHQPATRKLSNASSGDLTVRPRRPSSSSALSVPVPDEDDNEVPDGFLDPSNQSWTADPWGYSLREPPPPLWRQASDEVYNENEDPEQGPSDYWCRSSPPLSPELPTASSDPWLRNMSDVATPESEDEHQDTAEYSKRLEQVLSFADQSPTPSPMRRRDRNRAMYIGDGDDSGDDDSRQLHNGKGYDEVVRDVLHDGGEAAISPSVEQDEDEFGALPVRSKEESILRTPSTTSLSASVQERIQSPMRSSPSGPSRSYIHPSVSRLRSQPHVRSTSTSTHLTASSLANHTRLPSHFSQVSLSRSDSISTTSIAGPARSSVAAPESQSVAEEMKGPAFTFHPLRHLSAHLFNRGRDRGSESGASSPTPRPSPAKRTGSVLGLSLGRRGGEAPTSLPIERTLGIPTVMDTNGMIAVGTQGGHVVVYGFNQEVRCVLGNETSVLSGPVTAVTICPDQTWIGVGHASGNVFLWDLSHPSKPGRTCLAVTLQQVLSGRKEGHLQGTRIIHIGFVGKRHTSIVTADEEGRAFWFSLGRVMGVDSNDVVRMLGSYPEPERERQEPPRDSVRTDGETSAPSSIRFQQPKKPTTLFAALPLPIGTAPHATDEFHITALLTPVKLVIVGMKPSAKTWFRKMRDTAGGEYGGFVGCAVWLKPGEVRAATPTTPPSDPVLAYSWGTSLRFLRVRVSVTEALERPQSAGKSDKKPVPLKTPEFIEGRRWEAPNPIQSLHWFDSDHLLVITTQELLLVNVRTMRPVENTPLQTKLLTSQDFYSGLSIRKAGIDVVPNTIASSARTFREKLFLLTKANVQVGTLQHWNDRVLASVHKGDFLGAINLALAYYEGRATGNTIGLPEDPASRRDVVGTRVRELMKASLEWAFSEERMHDDTHFSADGRGVDLTSLFEGLATACIDACLAMHDADFLFDEAYEHFANAGIQSIFLTRLEGYIFEDRVSEVPPHVVQVMIAMHDQQGEYGLAEAIIWHIAPNSLDINQAVTLCEKHELWDALIYVYTRAMGDYAAPIVKLIGIVCVIQRARRDRPSLVGDSGERSDVEERLAPDAYKLYAYVANVLSGLWYPSGEQMREIDATRARTAAYGLLFSDRTVEWPEGSNELVRTDQSDSGGFEPAYPYLRLLLQFDTEAFLHAMDMAFEDSYLNDPSRAINRQTIINLMLDVMDDGFHSSDVTFLHIFVARNLPKYPQFIFIPPSTSHRILVSLASDPDQSTREDRQLAAEYLLSAYTPHDADQMLSRFEQAGFFRILRAAYRRDRKWGALIDTLLRDPDADDGVFASLDEIITSSKMSLGVVPDEVETAMSNALPHLFDLSVRQTALLLDRSLPTLHDLAIQTLDEAEHKQAAYLRCLLDPRADENESDGGEAEAVLSEPSKHLHSGARLRYASLLAQHDPSAVIPFLDEQGKAAFDLPLLAERFEAAGVPDGQLWALDRNGQRKEVFETIGTVLASRGADLAEGIHTHSEGDIHQALATLQSVSHMAIRLCREHSCESAAEDMWFGVLHSTTDLVHSVSALTSEEGDLAASVLETLRGLVQDTLQALLSTSSSHLSFARLFKRLVEAAPTGKGKRKKTKGGARAYSEFRAILSGMLDSFRQDTDVLSLSIRLVDADMFELLEEKVAKSQAGWRTTSITCAECHKPLWRAGDKVDVRANGTAVHEVC